MKSRDGFLRPASFSDSPDAAKTGFWEDSKKLLASGDKDV